MRFLRVNEYSTGNRGVLDVAAQLADRWGTRKDHTVSLAALFGFSDLAELIVSDDAAELMNPMHATTRGRRSVAAVAEEGEDSLVGLLEPEAGLFVAIVYARLAHAVRLQAPPGPYLPALVASGVNARAWAPGVRGLALAGVDTVDVVVLLRSDSLDGLSAQVHGLRSIPADAIIDGLPTPGCPLFRSTNTVVGAPLVRSGGTLALPERRPDHPVAERGALLTRLRFGPARVGDAEAVARTAHGSDATLLRQFGPMDAMVMHGEAVARAASLTWGQVSQALYGLADGVRGVTSVTELGVVGAPTTGLTPSGLQEKLSTARKDLEEDWLRRWKTLREAESPPWSMDRGTEALLRQVAQMLEEDPEGFATVYPAIDAFLDGDQVRRPERPSLFLHLREKVAALARREHPYRAPTSTAPLEGVGYQIALDAYEHVIRGLATSTESPPADLRLLVLDAPGGFNSNALIACVRVLTVATVVVRSPYSWVYSFHEISETDPQLRIPAADTPEGDSERLMLTGSAAEAYHDLRAFLALAGGDDSADTQRRRFWAALGPALVTELFKQGVPVRGTPVNQYDPWHGTVSDLLDRLFLLAYLTTPQPDEVQGYSTADEAWGEVVTWAGLGGSPRHPVAREVARLATRIFRDLHLEPVPRIRVRSVGHKQSARLALLHRRAEDWLDAPRAHQRLLTHLDAFLVPSDPEQPWLPMIRPAEASRYEVGLYLTGGVHFRQPAQRRTYQRDVYQLLGVLSEEARTDRARLVLSLVERRGPSAPAPAAPG